ncbi:FAD synthase [Candidatus Micrarchaeota archaeon]|nr:FAD synthase [Candidatus Micrarchaeota archaeon]
MKKVLVFGSFDILHPGHLAFFKSAKRFGNSLVVVVARDSSIKRLKGRKPYLNERERLEMVSALRIVDKAILGDKKDFHKPIEREKPDVIVLGYDQKVDLKELKRRIEERDLNTKVIRLKKPLLPEKYKSSRIRTFLESQVIWGGKGFDGHEGLSSRRK